MSLDGGGAKYLTGKPIYSLPDIQAPQNMESPAVEEAVRNEGRLREIDEWVERLKKHVTQESMVAHWRIPPLLDKRRVEHLIPDAAFASMPAFDRVHLYQIAPKDLTREQMLRGDMTHGDGKIIMTERVKEASRESNPRGILIGAGLMALDSLRSHGVDLGHIVRFQRLAPYRHEVASIGGKDFHILVLNVGCITASEDAERMRRDGSLRIMVRDGKHVASVDGAEPIPTVSPWQSEDT